MHLVKDLVRFDCLELFKDRHIIALSRELEFPCRLISQPERKDRLIDFRTILLVHGKVRVPNTTLEISGYFELTEDKQVLLSSFSFQHTTQATFEEVVAKLANEV